ncbi:hypothetical protein CAPTEDRAFT_171102 [Capitella teleta]|uniref:Fibrinogen C-terminal domain-containing protein n=1 Tax=Capitella teleta TaxID=283909 RepID=R7VBG6_CAPTE|nr:hypothetical protein CAPTEDRAFT_171102 [Capitella teleta]|eukprot:ELU15974.1 hypothetical protein CAPTEDRAFT_171102 [Capitella teleta]
MSAEGWTVIQRRWDDSVDFDRHWIEYQEGFGDPAFAKNFWIGLDNLYRLTNQRNYKLSITMRLANGEFRFANYDSFRIDSEKYNYALHVDGFSGNAGDAFQYTGKSHERWLDGMPFSTRDRDNDRWNEGSCGQHYRSGWWFNKCFWGNLNGPFKRQTNGWPACNDGICIMWQSIKGYRLYSLTRVEMKVMPNPRS